MAAKHKPSKRKTIGEIQFLNRQPQSRGLETRQKILATAMQFLEKEGIHELRFSQIARGAKIPQALMGYHFPNMESLLVELAQVALDKVKTVSVDIALKNAMNPKKAFVSYVRAPFELAAEDAGFRSAWTALYHLSTINPLFSEINLQIRKTGRERILNIITLLLATEGHLGSRGHISAEKLIKDATIIQGIITGLAIMAVSEAKADYRHFADLAVDACLKVIGLSQT